ncbi:MAG: HAMP domain-containing histidine kinase [Elusimicrobia bacterium]|nr:HAMP domain-containing histidine kinase [Elusimicrobiota bacterium]
MRIRSKLILLIGAILLLTAAVNILLSYRMRKKEIAVTSQGLREMVFRNFVVTTREAYRRKDPALLDAIFPSQWAPKIAYAYLADADGLFFFHTDPRFRGKRLEEWSKPPETVELREPVPVDVRGGGTVGLGFTGLGEKTTLKKVKRELLTPILIAALVSALLGAATAIVLATLFTRPLSSLARASEEIAKGNFKTQVSVEGRDELGELARVFNSMAVRLAQLDELKDNFLAQITHDLRNPLGAIIGYIELLRAGEGNLPGPKQTKYLRIVFESAHYLNDLVENILTLTTLEAGRIKLAPQWVDLGHSVGSVSELLRAKALEFGVAVENKVQEGATVWADEQALRRVLVNLVSNAMKFTPQGGTVSVEYSRDGDSEDRIAVRDTGVGIPADKLDQLFKKFSQIAETQNVARPSHGTGLGLVICKQFVEAHKGRIWVESEFGRGTTVSFTLPCDRKALARSISQP